MKRDMSVDAALRLARKRWGKGAALRTHPRKDGAKGKWCTIGHLALGGLFFMNKGEGASFREAFADADAREGKEHESAKQILAEAEMAAATKVELPRG